MTTKELLYVQDLLDHELQMKKAYNAFADQIKDPELKTFINSLCSKQTETFNNFYSLLG